MRNYLILCIFLLSGCASSGSNGFCGRVTGMELTVPYIGGKANIDGYACHVGCVGTCTADNYTALSTVMKDYANSQTTNGKIMTTGPGTVVFTPSK